VVRSSTGSFISIFSSSSCLLTYVLEWTVGFVMLLKRDVPGSLAALQISNPFRKSCCCLDCNWNSSPNVFEFLQVCQWWKALLAIHSEFIYWLLRSTVFWGTVSVLYNWKGEIQCAIKMVFDLFWYIFAKLTKCDMFARLGISAIQMLDVFLRHWGGLVSKQLSCPTLTPVFGHFYKPLNVTAGLMQLLYLLRLVSISEYSLDGLV
jgi:hypothetical protein